MRLIKLLISYDGADFQGWQKQPGRPSVQTAVEEALSKIYNEPIEITGSGRTDAGTHAIGQVAHFKAPKILATEHRLQRAMNSLLPESIVIKGAWLAPEDFHARKSAIRKTYKYRIWNRPVRSALWRGRALWVPNPIHLNRLNELSAVAVGRKDFKSFQTQGTAVKTTIRCIDTCQWSTPAPGFLELKIRGNGFLKQMVRNLVGTFLYLQRNDGGPKDLEAIFEAHDRQKAKATAPAHGLYLYHVEYPRDLDNKCLKL